MPEDEKKNKKKLLRNIRREVAGVISTHAHKPEQAPSNPEDNEL